MRFCFFQNTYSEILIDYPIGLHFTFTSFVIIGLFLDPSLIGLIIFNRLIGWRRIYTERDFE